MSNGLPILVTVIGGAFVLLAVVYALVPANALPSFVPGYDPALDQIHVKHSLAFLLAGVVLWAYAWFATRPKPPVVNE